jgi:subtilase family serine protease
MRRSRPTVLSLSAFSALVLSILFISSQTFAAAPDRIVGPIAPQQLVKLPAGVSRRIQPQFDRGPVDPSFKINYMTLLTAPSTSQQKAINQLLTQQQDPHSPLYHQWLTSQQYADRFGLSAADVQKLTTWLQSQGFTVENVARDRNWIAFSGTAAQVESAFRTSLHTFNINGEIHYANTEAPSIPSAVSGIVAGIRGLNDFRPKSHLRQHSPQYSYHVSGGYDLFLAPGDIATIYDLGPLYAAGIDGTGQKLAVVGRTDVYLSDINDFRAGFGLSSLTCTTNTSNVITACSDSHFSYVLNGPDPGVNPFHSTLGDDLPEADLDLEWSGAVAYNAQIVYVNSGGTAGDVFDAFYYAIDHDLAPVITMSYGICELGEAENGFENADEAELQSANSKGITFMSSSGDSGAAQCDPNNTDPNNTLATGGLAVNYPASSPEVTGVGGTMIPFSEYTSTYWANINGTNGGSAQCQVSGPPCVPEGAWNDAFEIGAYCAVNGCTGITNAETAQSSLGIGATGGGASGCITLDINGDCSAGFSQPTWQTVAITGQTSARFVPDVSILASPDLPGYIWCTQKFELGDSGTGSSCAGGGATGISNALGLSPNISVVGGTSASSPVFAGIVTLLNQYLTTAPNNVQSAPGLGNINPNLYQIAIANPTAFNPITAADFPVAAPGSNQVYCDPGSPGFPPVRLECPPAVAPATEGLFGYLSANVDTLHGTGYNLVTGLGSVDGYMLATVWESSKTLPSFTISGTPTSVQFGTSVTLTATVGTSLTTGAPTGTATFLNGSTTLGTGTLNSSGVATLTTTTLPVGVNHITASYGGDLYNRPLTTATAAVVTVIAPAFTLTNPSNVTTHTTLAGQTSLAYTFTATPTSASTFAGAVTFSCAFAPTDPTLTNSSCVFSPASIAAGASATPVTLTITTAGPNTGSGSNLRRRADNRSPWLPLSLPITGLVMAGLLRGKVNGKTSKRSMAVLFGFSLVLLGVMLACGGGSSSSTPPPVTVSVSPSTARIYANEAGNAWPATATQQQFSATVNNSTSQTVTWAVTGSSANGTIDQNTGLYTAPSTVPSPAAVTVTATASGVTGSATVNLLTPTGLGTYAVTVTATEAAVVTHTQTVTLTVQ